MPATLLAHQTLVLPLKMKWPRHFSGLALCLGSMAPDLEFIFRLADDWIFSHTVSAQLWFTVPLVLVLHRLLTRIVFPVLLPYVRDVSWLRLHDLAALEPARGLADWGRVAVSAWIGGMSHVVLDGITHGNHSGWLVPWFPFLRTPVPHLGSTAPLHDALQLWLTIGFGIACALMWRRIAAQRLLWRWKNVAPQQLPKRPRTHGIQVLRVLTVCAGVGVLLGASQPAHAPKATAAALAFGAIDVAALGALLISLWLRQRKAV
ncbi:DUF4184 family protein [Gemmatimonas phototrophica]|nr:DUF4184 family protein [Gemmatimonas phototrophica]